MGRLLAVVGVLAVSTAASASSCPARAELGGRSDRERLRFLAGHLQAEAARGDTWSHAWGLTYAGLTVAQLAASPLIVESDKIEWYVGAATSAIGIAFVVIDPLEVIEAGPGFARRAGWAYEPDEVCALIAEGEGLLERTAAHEQQGRSWYLHVGNVVLNIGLGLILGLGVGHWVAGVINLVVGVAAGELTVLTAPSRLISVWSDYQRGELSGAPPKVSFQLVPVRGGLGVAMSF